MPRINPKTAIRIDCIEQVANHEEIEFSERGLLFKGHTYRLTAGGFVRNNCNRFTRALTLSFVVESRINKAWLTGPRRTELPIPFELHERIAGFLDDRSLSRYSLTSRALNAASRREREQRKMKFNLLENMHIFPPSEMLRRSWVNIEHHAMMFAVFGLVGKKISAGVLTVDNERLIELKELHDRFCSSTIVFQQYALSRALRDEIFRSPALAGLVAGIECRIHFYNMNIENGWSLNHEALERDHPQLFTPQADYLIFLPAV